MKITMTIVGLIVVAMVFVGLSVYEPIGEAATIVALVLLGITILLVLASYLQGGGRGFPLRQMLEGDYKVLFSHSPTAFTSEDEPTEFLVETDKGTLFLSYPQSWLFVQTTTGEEKLTIRKVEGHPLFYYYTKATSPELATKSEESFLPETESEG